MEYRTGAKGIESRATLRLVDPEGDAVWEPDPAADVNNTDELDELAELFIGEHDAIENRDQSAGSYGQAEDHRQTDPARVEPAEPEAVVPETLKPEEISLEAIITGHLPVRGTVWVRAYAAGVSRLVGEPVVLVRVTPDRTSVELIGSSAETDPVVDVATAIRAAGCAGGHWLLHFDELDQASLLRTGLLDRVTVLSGADEPAIVSAYRLIKTIADRPDPAAGERAGRVGVAIVGADPSNTTRATERLVDATKQFLGMTLDVRPGVPRVRSTPTALLGDCDSRIAPTDVLSMIMDRQGRAEAPEPERFVEAESVDYVGELPAPSALVPDLKPLGLPCPIASTVELASDNAGRLHLLSWWSPEAPAHLLKASAWARVNLPLLADVRRDLNPEQCAPAQHVVCVDLGIAADLRGTNTIVHLAQPADRATAIGWICGRVN